VSAAADAVNEVKKDLTSIRRQLHELFSTEDQLTVRYSAVIGHHQPIRFI